MQLKLQIWPHKMDYLPSQHGPGATALSCLMARGTVIVSPLHWQGRQQI